MKFFSTPRSSGPSKLANRTVISRCSRLTTTCEAHHLLHGGFRFLCDLFVVRMLVGAFFADFFLFSANGDDQQLVDVSAALLTFRHKRKCTMACLTL